jgi:Tfp pilus assembly protein PilE
MHNKQRGITISGLVVWLVVLIVLALLGMKLIPTYIEYASAKNAIQAIARERNAATPADVRRFFDQRAQIDDITVIKGSDLDVTKQGNDMVISFAYRKEVPLFANVGLYVDFAADTGQ